jgi:predicted metalloendopeptidase
MNGKQQLQFHLLMVSGIISNILNTENLDRMMQLVSDGSTLVGQLYHKLLEQHDKPIDKEISHFYVKITSKDEFWEYNQYLLKIGTSGVYHICKETDGKDSTRYVPTLTPAGLGMGDKSYA